MPDIDTIEKRASEATEGPWVARESSSMKYCSWVEMPLYRNGKPTGDASTIGLVGRGNVTVGASELDEQNANCDFIAHARTDIPWLIAQVRELTARLSAAERENAALTSEPTLSEAMEALRPFAEAAAMIDAADTFAKPELHRDDFRRAAKAYEALSRAKAAATW